MQVEKKAVEDDGLLMPTSAFVIMLVVLDMKWFAIMFVAGTNIYSRIANVIITSFICFQSILASWKKTSVLSLGALVVAISMFFVNPVVIIPYEMIPFGTATIGGYFAEVKWNDRKRA